MQCAASSTSTVTDPLAVARAARAVREAARLTDQQLARAAATTTNQYLAAAAAAEIAHRAPSPPPPPGPAEPAGVDTAATRAALAVALAPIAADIRARRRLPLTLTEAADLTAAHLQTLPRKDTT